MFKVRRLIQPRARRARRGGVILLTLLWTLLWVSQAYAACCAPHVGGHHEPMNAAMEMHAIAQSEHDGDIDSQEPCCPQTLDDAAVVIASAQPGHVDSGKLTQPVMLQRAPPMLLDPHRPGNDRIPDSPGPPDRVYLRLQRFLI